MHSSVPYVYFRIKDTKHHGAILTLGPWDIARRLSIIIRQKITLLYLPCSLSIHTIDIIHSTLYDTVCTVSIVQLFVVTHYLKVDKASWTNINTYLSLNLCFALLLWLVLFPGIGFPWSYCYCMSKKYWPILYSKLLYKMGPDFLDIQYIEEY